MYELQGVIKAFGDGGAGVRAVDGIDLRINPGEFVVIEGPSGSGKSTLLQMLGALDRPTAGSVMFEGNDLALLPDRQLADLRLKTFGFIFQQFNLVPTLSAVENVEAALAPLERNKRARKERALRLLDGVGLRDRADHLPTQLSGGEQQRVAIARALSKGPRVILADEPTGNLDTRTGAEIMTILRRLATEMGQTVVLITHDPEIAASAPRVVRLRDGRVVADAKGSELAAMPATQLAPAPAQAAAPVATAAPNSVAPAPPSPDKWVETASAPKHQGEELLHAEGVVKHYITDTEDVVGVDGVSIIVHEGEFVAITGPSGSGKTTLLNCLSGLDRIDRGRVLITGQTVHDLTDKEQSHLRSEVMGFIFQNWNLVPVFSAVENVELPLLLNGVKPGEARAAATATLERIGLGHRLDHHPNALSGGEQQRVAIARALAAGPQVLWADEPTGNLDSHTAESVMQLLRELNDEGLAIILVTHDESIAETATRRIYMRDGQLLKDMTRKDAIGRPIKRLAKPVVTAKAAPAKPAKPAKAPKQEKPAKADKPAKPEKVKTPPQKVEVPKAEVPKVEAAPKPQKEKRRGRRKQPSFEQALQEIRESTEAIGTLTPEPLPEPPSAVRVVEVEPEPLVAPDPVPARPIDEIPLPEPPIESGGRQHAMTKAERRAARRASRMGYSATDPEPEPTPVAVPEPTPPAVPEPAELVEEAKQQAVPEPPPAPKPEPEPEAQVRRDPSPQPRRADPSPQPRPAYQSPMQTGVPEPVNYEDPF